MYVFLSYRVTLYLSHGLQGNNFLIFTFLSIDSVLKFELGMDIEYYFQSFSELRIVTITVKYLTKYNLI